MDTTVRQGSAPAGTRESGLRIEDASVVPEDGGELVTSASPPTPTGLVARAISSPPARAAGGPR